VARSSQAAKDQITVYFWKSNYCWTCGYKHWWFGP